MRVEDVLNLMTVKRLMYSSGLSLMNLRETSSRVTNAGRAVGVRGLHIMGAMDKISRPSMRMAKQTLVILALAILFLSAAMTALAVADNLLVFDSTRTGRAEPLTLIYSNGKIDVYVDQQTVKEAVNSPLSNENFRAHLYFVYKDESERRDAIKKIKEHAEARWRDILERRRENIIKEVINNPHTGIAPELAEKDIQRGKEEVEAIEYQLKSPYKPLFANGSGELDDLKYMMVVVEYFASGRTNDKLGSQPQEPEGLPLLAVVKTVYIAEAPRSLLQEKIGKDILKTGYDMILADETANQACIGREWPGWTVLSGPFDPQTNSFRLEREKFPLFYQVIQHLIRKIRRSKSNVLEK